MFGSWNVVFTLFMLKQNMNKFVYILLDQNWPQKCIFNTIKTQKAKGGKPGENKGLMYFEQK